MDHCDECGFRYEPDDAPAAAVAIVEGANAIADLLSAPSADPARRRSSDLWSPLEYGCHLRDVLLIQRERVLLARRVDQPAPEPMGRDERAEHDGYIEQDPIAVAAQLRQAAAMMANVLGRLGPADWSRTMTYNYPAPEVRSLRWLANHTHHEVVHHLGDIRGQS